MVAKALLDELTYGAVSRRERPVASHIPYTRHVDDHVIKTRDGLVMTILKCEGYSFETADISEINSRLLARNDLVRTLANSRFALVSHIIRREVQPRIASSFDNALCREIDERYDAALSQRRMFVNDLYLTIVRRPLQGQAGTFDAMLTKLLGRKDAAGESVASQTALSELHDAATAVRENLAAYGARQLGVVRRDGVWHSEPLEFLVQLVNGGIPRPMHLPRMALADALSMKRIFFGKNAIEIRGAGPEDTRFGAMVSIREYPAQTGPGSFDNLLRVPHEFIATQSFAIVDRPEAAKQIDRVARQVDMSDEAGSIIAEHLDEARDELLASEAIYGEHHMSVMCLGRTVAEVAATVTAVGAALTDRSVIWTREDLNCEPAFWAQLPGNFPYIARKSVISSKNFAGFTSLHNYPSGRLDGNHWGPAISVFETTSQTAYYYNHHVRDLGNFTVVGPSGSGKTVFLSFISAQSQRVTPRPKLLFVDKDRGAEIFIRAMGGQYEVLVPGEPTGFNPLSLPDTAPNREFLFQLLGFMLRPGHGGELSASEEQVIRNAIASALSAGPDGRTLKAFSTLLRGRIRAGEGDLLARLESWMRPDQRGWLFNNEADQFSVSSIFGFDMTRVLDDPVIRTAALMYIFHRTEELLTGDPVMIFLDEGWRLLDDPVFAFFIKDKLKTIRKQNGIIGFGTQSAADIVRSNSASTLIEQTATNVFFPNPKADDESYTRAFRLSEREVTWIRSTVPESRSFLIKHGRDSVIAKLNLAGMPDIIKVLSGRTETVAELDALRARVGDDPAVWLPIFMGRAEA
ncbi:VirB4 family type IV secretion system protein [Ancylobacter dichloromethanicus]|uniref:Type VI secretion protein n=1 Tax=Ancylobacter dichloromethanicus TaxID=518825 RepID=A0A9W6J5S2_9HYPH|nr:VirB4 family type IV secretion system protein [Ancylobacter dichloromethanicus]MBS7556018.1 VirB4 family type IV secretion system protein [Ancylobacter dichloromethanicus]GLK70248.1 type VI secretion protein [Ancylobacter dichloromethanicus]